MATMVHAGRVERAALATLRRWMPRYLRAMEAQEERREGSLPVPTYERVSDLETLHRQSGPMLVVVSSGVEPGPREPGPIYSGRFTLEVALIVPAADIDSGRDLARMYAAITRQILVDHPSLGDVAEATTWTDEDYIDVDPAGGRTTAGATVEVMVEVQNVLDASDPPLDPDEPDESYIVDEVIVDVIREPIAS